MAANILVTGATGTIGSILMEKLATSGHHARALVRSRAKGETIEKLGHEISIGDLDKPETLTPALAGIEKVFLLTAPAERQAERESNLVRAAKQAGVRHLVKLSVIGIGSGLEELSLGRQHLQTEKEIERSGMAHTHLRPNGFMQNMLRHAGTIKSQGLFYAPFAESKESCVDARDVAAVALAALTEAGHEGKAYEITGPESLTSEELAQAFSSALGREIKYVEVPLEAARAAMTKAGMQAWLVEAMVELFHYYREGKAAHVTDTVRQVTGREPLTFAQFARDYAPAFS